MKSLNTFINEFSDGFQMNNRFICKVITPEQLVTADTEGNAAVATWLAKGILCESTNLPDRAFAETPMTQYGLTEQFPYHSEFTTLDCTFNTPLYGTDNPVPRMFHAWQNLIQDMRGGYNSSRDFSFSGTNSSNGYYGELFIGVFDRQNNPTIAYEFERVYPRVVQSTPVTWREENELTKLTVGFTFSAWRPLTNVPEGFFPDTDLLRSAPLGTGPFQQNPMGYPGSPGYPGEFQNTRFQAPRTTLGGILIGLASDIINDVTGGRVRIG